MGYWNTRGLRGSTFEEIINMTNDMYRQKGLAMVQKIPTPIKPIKIDSKQRTITLAYFEQKSTVDYIGIVQGYSICFDAKETSAASLPLANIHEHQIEFMKDFENQKGIAFLLVYFTKKDECFLFPFKDLYYYYCMAKNGARKSIPYEAFDQSYKIQNGTGGVSLHYLVALQRYLVNLHKERESKEA
ncbi:Holliday junction resolvase RecU [Vallitalea okinawensis]|uniref:Holliday junction resolvase RecU n=1 Tax=Vallitalea okinawensis TaxID=2078660 RepID=UPI000CFBDB90|nr:Holliday junction resolvase RecU [Vallitalea okinawensis]